MTLFGIVDLGISGATDKSELVSPLNVGSTLLPDSIKASKSGLRHSGLAASRLGFRGVEDLGGGLSASFWLESGLTPDDGNLSGGLNFQRRSTVSLAGNFGEIRLGRDYKPTFWNYTVFDPFGTNGAGTSLLLRAADGNTLSPGLENSVLRASNSVGYFLPKNLGGFYGQVQFSFHEQAKYDNGLQGSFNANSRGGRYWGGRFGYANGPLDVALSYGEQTNTSSYGQGTDDVSKNVSLGASYDFGPVKLFGQYANVKRETEFNGLINEPLPGQAGWVGARKLDGYLLGVSVPVGSGLIRASYGHVKVKTDVNPLNQLNNPFFEERDPKADQLAVGYVHNLSKRTALYATVAYIKNKNGAAYSTSSTSGSASTTSLNVLPVTAYADALGNKGLYQPKTSIGYDLGIRHSF